MTIKTFGLATVAVAALALAGCGGGGGGLVGNRAAPDELSVVDAPPLTLPPDFELRPPRKDGDAVQTRQRTDSDAQNLLMGDGDGLARDRARIDNDPAVDDWLIEQAGGEKRDPTIRRKLEQENRPLDETGGEPGWWQQMFGEDAPDAATE